MMHFQPSAFIYLHLDRSETSPCCQQGAEARFLESGIESLTQTHDVQMTSTAPACQNTATFVLLWQKLLPWEPLAAWLGSSRAQFSLALICCGLPSENTSHGVTVSVQLPSPGVGEEDVMDPARAVLPIQTVHLGIFYCSSAAEHCSTSCAGTGKQISILVWVKTKQNQNKL